MIKSYFPIVIISATLIFPFIYETFKSSTFLNFLALLYHDTLSKLKDVKRYVNNEIHPSIVNLQFRQKMYESATLNDVQVILCRLCFKQACFFTESNHQDSCISYINQRTRAASSCRFTLEKLG